MNYSEAISYIQSYPDMERATFGARGPSMGLPSMRALLERMGNPHLGRKTIHVTGSKGKGSTVVMVSRILESAGFSTAVFTSPHLHDYRERIAFNGISIDEETFARAVTDLKPIIDAESESGNNTISTFGILAAVFFHLTAKSSPAIDWQVVEVGLGGRYDITNVFNTKELAIITPISLEHVEILGSTQTEIAANKAGIITPKCVCVLAPQQDQGARTAIGRRCGEVQANLVDVSREYKIRPAHRDLTGQTFSVESSRGSLELFTPMLGNHQVANAATAVAAAHALADEGFAISDEHIKEGIAKATIPGRFQILSGVEKGKLTGEPVIVVDAAHNHESAESLAESLKSFFGVDSCIFILGLNTDKNISAIWKQLLGLSRKCIATRSKNPRSMSPSDIKESILTLGGSEDEIDEADSVADAVKLALSIAEPGEIICITGSIYIVGEAREHVLKEEDWNLVSAP